MIYKIAGVYVDMAPKYPTTIKQSLAYISENHIPDFQIHFSDDFLKQIQCENPHLTLDDCEYIYYGSEFYNQLISYNAFLLHSSAVVKDNQAFLFSAPSGTGKSTHTQLWLKKFPDAYILNDDKPAIRITENGIFAFGTPFSGKTDWNRNIGVPLKGICVLERGTENKISRISTEKAIFSVLNQTVLPSDETKMDQLLSLLDKVLQNVSVYQLFCTPALDSVDVSYQAMK